MVPTPEKRTRDYRASVTCMDESIGKMLAFLDEKKIANDTMVIFFSDNGGGGGSDNSPLKGGKSKMWEGGIRVCAAVRWPGKVPAGKVNDEFLTSLEILPTVAALTGTKISSGLILDGFDMLPILQGKTKSPRKEMFWERKDLRAARVGNWKWVDTPTYGGLFDLSKDIGEKNDLSKKNPRILAMVKARYANWKKEMALAEPRGPFRDY